MLKYESIEYFSYYSLQVSILNLIVLKIDSVNLNEKSADVIDNTIQEIKLTADENVSITYLIKYIVNYSTHLRAINILNMQV